MVRYKWRLFSKGSGHVSFFSEVSFCQSSF